MQIYLNIYSQNSNFQLKWVAEIAKNEEKLFISLSWEDPGGMKWKINEKLVMPQKSASLKWVTPYFKRSLPDFKYI